MYKMYFLYWDSVRFDNEEINISKFIRTLERNLKSDDYNVIYNEDKKNFIITYNGIDYIVVFPEEWQKELDNDSYTPIVLKLIMLAKKDINNINRNANEKVRQRKIEEMDDSFYEDIESLEDYELYLEYLKKKVKHARNYEERNVLKTKIEYIDQIVTKLKKEQQDKKDNPLNLKLNINKFLYDIFIKSKQLDSSDRKRIVEILKEILDDYYEILNNKKNRLLPVENELLPSNILDRIIDVEMLLYSLLKNKGLVLKVNTDFDEIREMLKQEEGVKHEKQ